MYGLGGEYKQEVSKQFIHNWQRRYSGLTDRFLHPLIEYFNFGVVSCINN